MSVENISPASGPRIGGTIVTVYGNHLGPGTLPLCRFGNIAVPAYVASSSKAMCTSPPPESVRTPEVQFSFSVDGGLTYPTSKLAFTYTGVSPVPVVLFTGMLTRLAFRYLCDIDLSASWFGQRRNHHSCSGTRFPTEQQFDLHVWYPALGSDVHFR